MKILSALEMEARERCGLYAARKSAYNSRVDPLRALYLGVAKGVQSNFPAYAATTRVMNLAKNPGFAVGGTGVYQIAKHYAALAEVVVAMLRSIERGPWKPLDTVQATEGMRWKPALWRDSLDVIRSIWFVDHWSEAQELRFRNGWRGIGEAAMSQEIFYAEVFVIGQTRNGRREGPLTRAFSSAVNGRTRFGGASRQGWVKRFREDTPFKAERWVEKLEEEGLRDEVHKTIEINPPEDLEPYVRAALQETGAGRRLAGCGFPSRCPFYDACWNGADIESYGRIEEKEDEKDTLVPAAALSV